MTPKIIEYLLSEIAECLRMYPALHSTDLDVKLALLGYQLVRTKRRPFCWVLLKNGKPIAHASGGADCEAIQTLAKRC